MLDHEAREEVKDSPVGHDVQEMLMLAARLRAQHGAELDDDAIAAVSEATGQPVEFVRIALAQSANSKEQRSVSRLRATYLQFDPSTRRYVASGILAAVCGLLTSIGITFGDPQSLLGTLGMMVLLVAVYNAAMSRETKVGAIAGAIFGAGWFFSTSATNAVFDAFREMPTFLPPPMFLVFGALGAIVGGFSRHLVTKTLNRLGIRDRSEQRQDLLRQLVEIQDKLRSGEQHCSILSLDIVGSTKMKEQADPLAVEFTFGEYHKFVEAVAKRHQGRVHSTAGDGVTLAFEHPMQAFAAARNIQSGLIELNTHRNRLGVPIELRAGLHHGAVMAPSGDIASVNFSHVIDLAAHLQKACPPGGVAVSEAAAGLIPGGMPSIGPHRVQAESVSAAVWLPRTRSALGNGQSRRPPAPPV